MTHVSTHGWRSARGTGPRPLCRTRAACRRRPDGRPPDPPGARQRAHGTPLGEQRRAALTSAVGPLVRAVGAVLDPVAEAGHEDTQLGAKAVVLVRLTSLGLTLWTWGQTERSVWACWLQRLAGQLLTGGEAGELRLGFQAPAMFRSQEA